MKLEYDAVNRNREVTFIARSQTEQRRLRKC